MPTNDRDIQALTYLAKRLRQETYGAGEWDEAGIFSVVKGFKGHELGTTIERVTRHASDTEARTPKAMERPFIPDAPKGAYRHPVKAGTDCRQHPGEDARLCRLCAVDHIPREGDPIPTKDTSAGAALRAASVRRNQALKAQRGGTP